MMSAAVCFKLWGAREREWEGGSSQLPGLPHGPRHPSRWDGGRYSPPGWGTWRRPWSHPAGSELVKDSRWRPVQGMGLNQPRQETRVGLPGFPSQFPFFPPQLLSWLIQVSCHPWTGQGSPHVKAPNPATDFHCASAKQQ